MEQKQLDDLDESYFGEEFIDDEEIKIEDVKPAKAKTAKKKAEKKTSKKSTKKEATNAKPIELDSLDNIQPEIDDLPPVEVTEITHEEPLVKQTSAAPLDTPKSDPIDPWANEEEDENLFKETSTWKAITGIAVILLILSVFTGGFHFSGPTGAAVADGISLDTAEQKALTYVNDKLLQPPFVATVEKSEDVGTVYKITLNLAGEPIESYMTKDGEFFFPQGFDVDGTTPTEETVDLEPVEPVVKEEPTEEPVVVDVPTEEPVEVTPPVEEKPVEVPVEVPAEPTTQLSMSYKKWSFSPTKLTVKQGDKVSLTVSADTSNPSFALPGLTLGIPGLGVEQAVEGTGTVEFTADKAGSFELLCASCSGTQAAVMKGTLVVE